jgi:hypothetical protein
MISYLTDGQQQELIKWLLTNYSEIPANSSGFGISEGEPIIYETQHQIVERKRHISTHQPIPSSNPFDTDLNHFVNFESQQETSISKTIVLSSIEASQIQSKSSLGTEKMINSREKPSVNQAVSTATIIESSSSENARSFPQPFSHQQQTEAKFDSTSITNALAKPLSTTDLEKMPISQFHLGDYVTLSDGDNTSELAQVIAIKGDIISIQWHDSQIIEKYKFNQLKTVKNGE